MSEGRTDSLVAERIGANLRRLRAAAGISQEELAFRAGIHQSEASLIEGGRRVPRARTLIKLSGALGVTIDDLVDGITWDPSRGFGVSEDGEDPGA
ncbi:MAG: helix-turn-helix transcriptional regulator [Actinobacteria bacterium]|nr:helix-turn-helix transcriptional regulator [Actinomycetota bacterium]